MIPYKTTILPLLITGVVACFAISPMAQAVVPAPDGGYPGGNTAEGQNALFSLTTGGSNTAVGYLSLRSDTTGAFNTAIGAGTLLANTADANTASGTGALLSNTTGRRNTANGAFALFSNTEGLDNAATGLDAVYKNTTGFGNTANGAEALYNNSTGNINTANGSLALTNNTTGSGNTALGYAAGVNVTTANNVTCIGNNVAGENVSNATYIGGIYGTFNTAQSAVVYIDPNGRLGTGPSARRFKKDIADMGAGSEVLLSMRPVTFHFKTQDTEKAGQPVQQFGLIAEEVAELNPDLILRDKEGQIYSVRYDQVNAMLLNEFLKEHRKNEKQEVTIARQQEQIEALLPACRK